MKKNLFLILRFAVSFGLIGYIAFQISRKQNLADLLVYFSTANYLYLAGAILLLLVIVSLGSLRWGRLLWAQGFRLSSGSVFMYYMIGFFFNNFLPTTVGGDVVKIYYLSKFTHKGAGSFISVVMDRIMGMMGLCVVAVVALLLGGRNLWVTVGAGTAFPIFLIVGGVSAGLLCFFAVAFNKKVMNVFLKLAGKGKIGEKVRKIHQSVYVYKGQGVVLGQTLFLSVIIWTVIIIIVWMIYLAFQARIEPIPLSYFFLFIPAIGVIMSLPISVAGLGTREAAFILFFTTLPKINDSDALIMSLTLYFVFLAASMVGGIIYVLKDQLHFHREEITKIESREGEEGQ